MERRSFSSNFLLAKTVFQALVGLGVCLLLSSCLDLNVDIQLTGESAGTVKLEAFSYRLAQGIQIQDGDALVPALPTTREEWLALLATVPGTTLTAFDSQAETLGVRTHTVVSFANARALEGLFALFRQKASLTLNGTVWNLSLAWLNPNFRNISKQNRDLWNALWGDREWVVNISAPRAVRIQSGGGQVDASRATKRVKLADFASDSPPAEWKLSW